MERFDIFTEQGGIGASPETGTPATNGHGKEQESVTPVEPSSPAQSSWSQKRHADSEDRSDQSSKSPPAKKKKQDNDVDADALFAAKLQAEENMRARPTRGSTTRRAPLTKKKTKAKMSKKVKAEDDSDLDSGSDTGKKVNRSGGFHVGPPSIYLINRSRGADLLSETPNAVPCSVRFIRRRGNGMTPLSGLRGSHGKLAPLALCS